MTNQDITLINEKVKKESGFIEGVIREMQKVIVGQRYLLDRLMVGILANGHILLEGSVAKSACRPCRRPSRRRFRSRSRRACRL